MKFVRDHYEVLGVPVSADAATIRRAHRVRAVYDHRRGALGIKAQLEMLQEARDLLLDPDQRRAFDALREDLLVRPQRQRNDIEAERVRREGRRRQALNRRIGVESQRLGRARVAQNETTLATLGLLSTPRDAPSVSRVTWARRLGVLVGLALILVVALAVLLYLTRR
ncbi:MAG: DnaJ domain-containing protein [Polyangiaceae bacterium]